MKKYRKKRNPNYQQKNGDRLHRSAFAVCLKMSNLLSSLIDLMEELDFEMEDLGDSKVNKGQVLNGI